MAAAARIEPFAKRILELIVFSFINCVIVVGKYSTIANNIFPKLFYSRRSNGMFGLCRNFMDHL